MALQQIPSRQLDLGPAQYFEPYPEDPAGNQIKVRAGWLKNSTSLIPADVQTTVAFTPVPTANHIRWDLVYLDLAGAVHTLVGTANLQPVPIYTGAPDPPAYSYPVALVRVNEAGTVVVDSSDITDVRPRLNMLEDRAYSDPHYVYPASTYYKDALEGLATEADRVKDFLGKDSLARSLPDYHAATPGHYISVGVTPTWLGDNLRNAVGKLDAVLYDHVLSLNWGRLARNSNTELQLEASDPWHGRNFVVVKNELVSLSSPKTLTTSVHLLASDGTDSGNNPVASTLYRVYLSNSQASWRPSSLALYSSDPTTDGYLAASGNGANWRFVGAVYLNASVQIANSYNLCGYNENLVYYLALPSDITKSSGSSGWYDCQSIGNIVVIPETKIRFIGCTTSQYDDSTGQCGCRLYVDGVIKMGAVSNVAETDHSASCYCSYDILYSAVDYFDINTEYYYRTGMTCVVQSTESRTQIGLVRGN